MQLSLGQNVRIREGVEKYRGLFGRIIHRQRVTGSAAYHREPTHSKLVQGRLAVVVQLKDPPAGVEPVILCYEEQVTLIANDEADLQ